MIGGQLGIMLKKASTLLPKSQYAEDFQCAQHLPWKALS